MQACAAIKSQASAHSCTGIFHLIALQGCKIRSWIVQRRYMRNPDVSRRFRFLREEYFVMDPALSRASDVRRNEECRVTDPALSRASKCEQKRVTLCLSQHAFSRSHDQKRNAASQLLCSHNLVRTNKCAKHVLAFGIALPIMPVMMHVHTHAVSMCVTVIVIMCICNLSKIRFYYLHVCSCVRMYLCACACTIPIA